MRAVKSSPPRVHPGPCILQPQFIGTSFFRAQKHRPAQRLDCKSSVLSGYLGEMKERGMVIAFPAAKQRIMSHEFAHGLPASCVVHSAKTLRCASRRNALPGE